MEFDFVYSQFSQKLINVILQLIDCRSNKLKAISYNSLTLNKRWQCQYFNQLNSFFFLFVATVRDIAKHISTFVTFCLFQSFLLGVNLYMKFTIKYSLDLSSQMVKATIEKYTLLVILILLLIWITVFFRSIALYSLK